MEAMVASTIFGKFTMNCSMTLSGLGMKGNFKVPVFRVAISQSSKNKKTKAMSHEN